MGESECWCKEVLSTLCVAGHVGEAHTGRPSARSKCRSCRPGSTHSTTTAWAAETYGGCWKRKKDSSGHRNYCSDKEKARHEKTQAGSTLPPTVHRLLTFWTTAMSGAPSCPWRLGTRWKRVSLMAKGTRTKTEAATVPTNQTR